MGEWTYIWFVPLSAMLFAIGGTGYKWVRRYVLPVLLVAAMLTLCGVVWWKGLLAMALLCGTLHLPYGDSIPTEILKFLVFSSYFIALLPLGITAWMIFSPIILFFMWSASNQPWGEKIVVWKIWELTAGFLIGITIARLIT